MKYKKIVTYIAFILVFGVFASAEDQVSDKKIEPTEEQVLEKPVESLPEKSQEPESIGFFQKTINVFKFSSKKEIYPVPDEFKESKYTVIKKITPLLMVIKNSSEDQFNEADQFLVFLKMDNKTCLVNVLDKLSGELILDGRNCSGAEDVEVGDFILKSDKKNYEKFKNKALKNNFAFLLNRNSWGIASDDYDSDSTGLTYGLQLELSSNNFIIKAEWLTGKLDAGEPSDDVEETYFSYDSVATDVLYRFDTDWQPSKFVFIPVLGVKTNYLYLKGSRADGEHLQSSYGVSPLVGTRIYWNNLKSTFDISLSYCVLFCSLTDGLSKEVSIYSTPSILSFNINGRMDVLPSDKFSLMWSFKFFQISASAAVGATGEEEARDFTYQTTDLGLGIGYLF